MIALNFIYDCFEYHDKKGKETSYLSEQKSGILFIPFLIHIAEYFFSMKFSYI